MKQQIDKHRGLLLLPLLILPFLALGFYALGGGKEPRQQTTAFEKGINTSLPDAQFSTTDPLDKMAIYNLKLKDSSDANHQQLDAVVGKYNFRLPDDPQTKQINEKLSAINREINTPYQVQPNFTEPLRSPVPVRPGMSTDVNRLESLIRSIQQPSDTIDPEISQLNSMMDKIMDIQHPELKKQRLQKSLPFATDSLFKAIPAIIAENQKVIEGAVVKLKILDTVRINGQLIPKGHLIFGLAAFSNQRLNLEIKNVRLGNSIIPVNLTVFDQRDAMAGINAPEVLLTEALNGGTIEAMGSISLPGFDQGLTTQLAGAGIDAAKSLFTKKLRRIKQKLKAGYPLLLRDNTIRRK
ncbi:conjugal transfer protein TraM [Pedobacter sp. KBW06]|uniref:conjugative transposon protein TraM n=1 Tax=Pedobacter sp. KBW06 TaxID=2153359 RepID=UPI000F591C81|nr:conjugative transposon protein TraM [Pedobacter sp. KBW06]RQO75599.1 conjugal transfer protein TraM [Pedobacter sp. KBW06]